MSRNPRTHPSPRARPVAEAPIGALLERADELARGWAIALILARPLERIGEINLEALARDAPALCAQAVRALESDAELERMVGSDAAHGRGESASAHKLAALVGGRDAESAVDAVEALRGVLWEALMGELRDPPARQVADLADRLAYVCATALAATVAAGAQDAAAETAGPAAAAVGAGDSGADPGHSHGSPIGPRGAVLIDERADAPTAPAPSRVPAPPAVPDAPVDPAPASPPIEQTHGRPRPWDPVSSESRGNPDSASDPPPEEVTPPAADAPAGGSPAPEDKHAPEIEVRDERREEGPAAWIRSIGGELERFEQDKLPFAVLLVELGDVERLRRAALPGGVSNLTDRIEHALTQELQRIGGPPAERRGRPGGRLTRERPGRYWLLAPATDAAAARRLAEWLVRTIEPLASRRWAPLEVKVGTAVCPDDGREAAALAAHADLVLDARRAAGRPIASVDEPF